MEADNRTRLPSRKCKNNKKSRRKKMLKTYRKRVLDADEGNSETYKYLLRILEVIETVRDDPYEMEVLAGNAFKEIRGNEVFYSKTNFASKLLEDLIPHASDEDLVPFVESFTENLRPIFSNRTASHTLEKILTESLTRYRVKKCDGDDKESPPAFYTETILKIAKFSLNNLESFIWDSSSNHVMRTTLNVLSGRAVKGQGEVTANDLESKMDVPDEFESILEKFAGTVASWPQFNDLCYETLTSGFLQTLLTSLTGLKDVSKAVVKKIIEPYKGECVDLKDEKNEPFLRLIEVVIEVASEKMSKKIYKIFFKRDLKCLAASKTGNFAVQKLLRKFETKENFEILYDDLIEGAEEIFRARNTGVLLELAKGCARLKTKQGDFVKTLMKILQCKRTLNEDSDISPLTCCMVTSDEFDEENTKLNLHGVLIVETLLHFSKPIKIINSLLRMESKQLLKLLSDPRGCHIADAFFRAPFVGEKSRDRLFKKFVGLYAELATSKHGSRTLDAIWSGITTRNGLLLLDELKNCESELTANQFGKLFARKNHLGLFRRDRDEWIKWNATATSAAKLFSDIIPEKRQKLM